MPQIPHTASYSDEWIDVSTLYNYEFNYDLGKVVQKKFPSFFAAPADGWNGDQQLRIPTGSCVRSATRVDCDLSKSPIVVELFDMPKFSFGGSPVNRPPPIPPEAAKFLVTGFHLGPNHKNSGVSSTVDLIYSPLNNLTLPGYPLTSVSSCANF